MTTILELIDTAPASTDGLPVTWQHDAGQWRGVFQIADPLAGAAVEWYDLTEYLLGYNLTRGTTTYGGRPEATVANIEVMADHGILAPTRSDTSSLFGTHVALGPGLLARFSLIRVAGGVVVEWLPRFTCKVEDWGNASHARGQIRRHLIVARDTFTSLVDVPVPSAAEQDWSDKVIHITTGASWQYGILAYHDFSLLLPARDEQDSAVRELDAALDPTGLVWFTDRYGHLYIRPRPGDTLHTGAGYSLPNLSFHYQADDDSSGLIAYGVDHDASEPFGISKSETGVKNRVVITSPGGVFDQDDATSVQRFDPKPYRATWIAENDQAALDLLTYRKYAELVATPLYTCIGQPGFHDLLLGDYLSPAAIEHTASIWEEVTSSSGVVRRMEESARFTGPVLEMSIRTTLDIESLSTSDGLIQPVDDLALDALGDTGAVFTWTNPTQVVTPTHTQIRMLGVSAIWVTLAYPITGYSWGGLDPNTSYQFQVRLVEITSGIVTASSSIRTLNFTTTFTQPIIDGDGGGVTFPPPECGSLDWELQESDDGTTWTVIDDGTISAPPWELDLTGYTLDPTKLYRIWQDACGDETYSNLFTGACSDPPALGAAPFDDAVAYWPAICPPGRIVEAITESPASNGPRLDTFVLDGELNVVLVADGEGAVAYGFTPGTPVPGTSDQSITVRVNLASQPDDPITLFGYEGLAIQAYAHGAKWAMRIVASEDGAGFTTLSSGDELDFGAWYALTATHDVSAGDLIGYVSNDSDPTIEFSALGSVGARTADGTFTIGQSDNGLITNCAVWDRVLVDDETPWFVPDVLDPVSGLPWAHLYWAGGPTMVARGYTDGQSLTSIAAHKWPDEITGTNALDLEAGVGIYKTADSNVNGQPSVRPNGAGGKQSSGIPASGKQVALPFTVVVIFQISSVSGTPYVVDGASEGGSGNRVLLRVSSGPVWSFYMGTDRTGGTPTTGIKAARMLATSGNDLLTINGSTIISGVSAGGATWQGVTMGEAGVLMSGAWAFYGVYPGDITADPNWSAFQAWVLATYGVSIS